MQVIAPPGCLGGKRRGKLLGGWLALSALVMPIVVWLVVADLASVFVGGFERFIFRHTLMGDW